MAEAITAALAVAAIGCLAVAASAAAYGTYASWRRGDLLRVLEEFDDVLEDFELERPTPSSRVWRGRVTPVDAQSLLRAPLSGRECVAYRIRGGRVTKEGVFVPLMSSSGFAAIPFRLDDGPVIRMPAARDDAVVNRLTFPTVSGRGMQVHGAEALREEAGLQARIWKHQRPIRFEWILAPNTICEIAVPKGATPVGATDAASTFVHPPYVFGSGDSPPLTWDSWDRPWVRVVEQGEQERASLRAEIEALSAKAQIAVARERWKAVAGYIGAVVAFCGTYGLLWAAFA
jgi:hypothetical protein